MSKSIHWCRRLSCALIGALLFTHAALAMPLCGDLTPSSPALVGHHTDEDCIAAAVAEPSPCPQRYGDIHKTTGPAGPNVPPAAVSSALLLPQAPRSLDPAAIHRRSADAIPCLSKSVLFCSWLS